MTDRSESAASSSAELEEERLRRVRELDEEGRDWREQFAPGSFGCHEALDRTALLMNLVADHLDHPGIVQDPEWYRLAKTSFEALWDLYQAIGAAHLNGETESASSADPT